MGLFRVSVRRAKWRDIVSEMEIERLKPGLFGRWVCLDEEEEKKRDLDSSKF